MIYVIDDDEIMAECIAGACKGFRVQSFTNAINAMNAMSEGELPDLIFLDILLDGPDGFTFLNELASYSDTAKISIIIISSLDFSGKDLSAYGIVEFLDKSTMRPEKVYELACEYAK